MGGSDVSLDFRSLGQGLAFIILLLFYGFVRLTWYFMIPLTCLIVVSKDLVLQWRKWKANLCQIITPVVCLLFLFILQIIVDEVIIPELKKSLPFTTQKIPSVPLSLPVVQFASALQDQFDLDLPLGIDLDSPDALLLQYNKGDQEISDFSTIIPDLFTSNVEYTRSSEEADDILFRDLERYADDREFDFPYIGALKLNRKEDHQVDYIAQYPFQGPGTLFSFGGRYSGITNLCEVMSLTMLGSCESILGAYMLDLVHSSYLFNTTNNEAFSLSFVAQMPFEFDVDDQLNVDVVSILSGFIFPLLLIVPLPSILYSLVLEKEHNIKEMMNLMGLKERNYIIPTFFLKLLQVLVTYFSMFVLGIILQLRIFVHTDFLIICVIGLCSALVVVSLAFFISSIVRNTFVATIVSYLIVVFFPIIGFFLHQFVLVPGRYEFKWLLLFSPLTVTESMSYASSECNRLACVSITSFLNNPDLLITVGISLFDFFLYFGLALYLDQVMPKPWGIRKSPFFILKYLCCCCSCCCSLGKKVAGISSQEGGTFSVCTFLKEDVYHRYITKKNTKSSHSVSPRKLEDEEEEDDDDNTFVEDEDVYEMKRRICEDLLSEDEKGIIVKGLTKAFGTGFLKRKHLAVNDIFFNVGKKECFGLLGVNGAGKSTTIRILSGLYSQTRGTAIINNMDIRNNMSEIRRSLGLCPQFTIYWPELTPTEHLLFYTRLKGCNILKERKRVRKLLKKVELLPKKRKNIFKSLVPCFFLPPIKNDQSSSNNNAAAYYFSVFFNILKGMFCCSCNFFRFFISRNEKTAGELSGGMMRRLAIAISLCGNPSLVLFDEPTTGLDPFHKRGIWNVIMKEKRDRCIILTTHSMEEAEVLSDRISIMKDGKLLCVGPSLFLKDKFGTGYKLITKLGLSSSKTTTTTTSMLIKEEEQGNDEDNILRFKEEVFSKLSPFSEVKVISDYKGSVNRVIVFQISKKQEKSSSLLSNSSSEILEQQEQQSSNNIQVWKIFEELEKMRKVDEFGLIDFEVNQASLEDVFLRVVGGDEEKDEAEEEEEEEEDDDEVITGNARSEEQEQEDEQNIEEQQQQQQQEEIIEIVENNEEEEGGGGEELDVIGDRETSSEQEQEQEQEQEKQEEEKENLDPTTPFYSMSLQYDDINAGGRMKTLRKKIQDNIAQKSKSLGMIMKKKKKNRKMNYVYDVSSTKKKKKIKSLKQQSVFGVDDVSFSTSSSDESSHSVSSVDYSDDDDDDRKLPDLDDIGISSSSEWTKTGLIVKSNLEKLCKLPKEILLQILFLSEKNLLLSCKNWKSSCLQLLSPFFVVALLFGLTLLTSLIKNEEIRHPEILKIPTDKFIPCTSWGDVPCYTLAYTTNGNPLATKIMDDIVKDYGFEEGEDVRKFATTGQLEDFLFANPNVTQSAVSFFNFTAFSNISSTVNLLLDQVRGQLNFEPFNSSVLFVRGINLTNLAALENITSVLYTVYYNSTRDVINEVIPIKNIIDNYIYYHVHKEKKILDVSKIRKDTFTVSRQNLPKIENRRSVNGQQAVLSATGALFFSLSTLTLFVVSLYRLVLEKETELRYSLEMIGMRQASYMISWFLTFVSFGFIMTLVSIVSGEIFVLDPFVHSNPVFTFIIFFVFQLSLIFLSFTFSSCFTQTKSALTFGFVFLSLSFILNLFVGNGAIVYLIMDLKGARSIIPIIFELFYPPFNFAKLFQDVINKTVKEYDVTSNSFKDNVGYRGWSDFVEPNDALGIEAPPSYRSVLMLLVNCIIYLLLFLYLDQILPTPKGNSKSPFFCCFPKYWISRLGFNLGKEKINQDLARKSKKELGEMKPDLKVEYNRVRDKNYDAMIRIANLNKTYSSLLGKKTRALRGIDLTCARGSVLAFLGHNGAGKSTTINMIAGLMKQNSGEIFVNEFNTLNHISKVRESLGVCLQHDSLWDELTPNEHMRLFCRMKGIRWGKKLRREVRRRLEEVSLYKNARKKRSVNLSGGMKRRLSVALSFVGNPGLVILDEPSTGLDPHSRRLVWKVIENAYKKHQTSIMLTTHSMEEADSLSHSISILQKGKILVVGDSLYLKSLLGEGYVLKFICQSGREEEFEGFIREKAFPLATKLMANSSSFIYNISKDLTREMIDGIKVIEENMNSPNLEERLVKDFGISSSTLEDIYLRVTKEDEEKEEEEAGESIVMTRDPVSQELGMEREMTYNDHIELEEMSAKVASESDDEDHNSEGRKSSENGIMGHDVSDIIGEEEEEKEEEEEEEKNRTISVDEK